MSTHVRFMPGRVRGGLLGESAQGTARGAWAPARRVAVVLAVVVCGVLVSAGSAVALDTHVFSSSFGGAGSGAGQVMLAVSSGVAVDSVTHDVYVADTGNARIDEFEADGAFVRAWGWGVADGLPSFEVCTLSCQVGISGSGPGQFESPVFVAVDNSAGPSNGDVYVGDTGDGIVTKFSASGGLVGAWGSGGQLDGSSTGAGSFGGLSGVAVGGGTLYVISLIEAHSHVFEFEQEGTFSTELAVVRETLPVGLAVDSAGDLLKANGDHSVEEFTGAGSDVGEVSNGVAAAGLSVDEATGDLYVAESGGVAHYAFAGLGTVSEAGGGSCSFAPHSGCAPTDSFGAGTLQGGSGIGVDSSSGAVYVADASGEQLDVFVPGVRPDVTTGSAKVITGTSETLEGAVVPDGVSLSDCHFDYGTSTAYGQVAPCVPSAAEIPADSNAHAVTAEIVGLARETTYHFRLQASDAGGVSFGQDEEFATPPPPAVTGATTGSLTGTSVDLDAQIDPEGLDTTYRFEYGTSTAYGTSVPVPDADIGAGAAAVPVTTHVSGLTADTAYHWRVVARNASGTTTGVDHVFIYDTAGRGVLPDGREYEMVSPPRKDGALVNGGLGGAVVVADVGEDGSRVIIGNLQCLAGAVSCPVSRMDRLGGMEEFSRTGGGWVASSLEPAARAGTEVTTSTWVSYSADAGTALFTVPTPPFGEDDFYARQPDGSFSDIGPLTPPSEGPTIVSQLISFFEAPLEATTDFSHVVYQFFPPGGGNGPGGGGILLEHLAGGEAGFLVGVSGGLGSTDQISECGTTLGTDESSQNAMSGDGRIVYFTSQSRSPGFSICGSSAPAPPVNELFARVDGGEPGAHTVAVSQPGALLPAPANLGCTTAVCIENTSDSSRFRGATFVAGSADGSRVFFLSEQQLVDGASEDLGNNLYLYDFAAPAGHNLVDVSAGDTSGGGPRVSGVSAVSSDGSHVYFVADGVLSGAANREGQVAREGAANLYVFERDAAYPEGRVLFIAAVFPGIGANVTPDGRFLVFTSGEDLTPDDTRTGGAQQVFRYDAQSRELVRISIGENGFNDNGNAGVGDASIVEGVPSGVVAGVERTDPTMSHDGAFVFFMSPVALTPGALNDVQVGVNPVSGAPGYAQNVYEYHDGGVYLISDGRDTSADISATCERMLRTLISSVCLIGVDGSGANVFFSTDDQLAAADTDTAVDIYDARVCTASEPCVAPAAVVSPCVGEGCRGVPEGAPSLLAPASASFVGTGNAVVPAPAVKAKKKAKPKKATRRAHGKKPKKRGKAKRGKKGRGARVSGKHVKRGRR
jgi:hypothetical protein